MSDALTPEVLDRLLETAKNAGAVVGIEKEQFIALVEMAKEGVLPRTITQDCGCTTTEYPDRVEVKFCRVCTKDIKHCFPRLVTGDTYTVSR